MGTATRRIAVAAAVTGIAIGSVAMAGPAFAADAAPTRVAAVCTTYGYVQLKSNHAEVARIPRSAAGSYSCTMALGNKGAGVSTLQNHLDYCNQGNLAVDGVFGNQTDLTLTELQIHVWDITGDGVYGNQTRGAMLFFASDLGCYRITSFVGF